MEKSKDSSEPPAAARDSGSVVPSPNKSFYPSFIPSIVILSVLLFTTLYILTSSSIWPANIFSKQEFLPFSGPIAATIIMPLDHFNSSDTRTYANHYWMNDTFYEPGGPVFLYDAGEAGISDAGAAYALNNPAVKFAPIELAIRYHGIVIMWEHRFFGGSMPSPVSNRTGVALAGIEAYRYLNNEQALEDVVYFARNFHPPGYSPAEAEILRAHNSPWIWIGGSYPGVRAAMIRVRNPDVFFASWASSAPVQTQIDNSVYYNPIYQSMPKNCSADIHAAITYADKILMDGTGEAIELIKKAIWLANSANPRNISFARTPQDLSYWNVSQILSYPFQSTFFHFQSVGYERSLGTFCNQLETWSLANSTPFTFTSNLSTLETNNLSRTPTSIGLAAASYPKNAFYAYLHALIHKSISDFQQFPNSPRKRSDAASWNWQLCTQFAQFQVSQYPSPHNLLSRFYNLTNHFHWFCLGMFPYAPAKPAVEEVLKYGGWKMRPSNVMFTNGELDPWRGLGVQSDRRINPESLQRRTTSTVPKCGVPPDGDEVFGAVWEGAVHVRDLRTRNEAFEGSPVERGLELFGRALDQWLPCFDSRKSELPLLGKERLQNMDEILYAMKSGSEYSH